MDKSTQSRKQPKAPETSAIKGVKENIDKKIERRTEKKEKEHTEPETHTEIESRSDVVISYPETGEIKYDVHGRGAKTKEQLKREYDQMGKKYKKMIKFVYQNSPKGTGDAVLKCKNLIKSKYFLMLMPDDLIIKKNCSSSLIKLHKKYNSSIIASKIVNIPTNRIKLMYDLVQLY